MTEEITDADWDSLEDAFLLQAKSDSRLRVMRVRPEAKLPRYATGGAAGLDLSAATEATLFSGEWLSIPTGIAIELPRGHEGQIRPRSGLAQKHGITVLNAPGTIDADFRGEIRVLLYNAGSMTFEVERGMRIAQLVVAPVTRVEVEETEFLAETARGTGGFGSTGI